MDPHIEILAMNIKMGVFGLKTLTPEWVEWAEANPQAARDLRKTAQAMIDGASATAGRSTAARTSHHHSLGWLFN